MYLPASCLDPDTVQQVEAMCRHPASVHVRCMPDCHKGSGCCVGFTCHVSKCFTPQLIGGDIGCGISAHPLPPALFAKRPERQLERINQMIHDAVPMGIGHERIHEQAIVELQQLEPFLREASSQLHHFVNAIDRLDDNTKSSLRWTGRRALIPPRADYSAAFSEPPQGAIPGSTRCPGSKKGSRRWASTWVSF